MITYVVCLYRLDIFNAVCRRPLDLQRSRYGAEIILESSDTGICEAYERGRKAATFETVVYLHDDVELLDEDATPRILSEMALHDADLLGVVGSRPVDTFGGRPSLPWWSSNNVSVGSWCYVDRSGRRIYQGAHQGPTAPYDGTQRVASTGAAGHLDGILLADRSSIPWPVDFAGWHGYDAYRCEQMHAHGLRVAVGDVMVAHHMAGSTDMDALRDGLARVRRRWVC